MSDRFPSFLFPNRCWSLDKNVSLIDPPLKYPPLHTQASGAANQCSRPREEAGPSDTPLFGECMFYKDNVRRS